MKRVVSLGLAAVMTASLAACGSSSSDTTTAAADAAENTAAAEGGDSASAEGGSFKIGVIGPLTGDNAAYGLAVQHGAELAAKEINEAGGINGASIELQAQDDEADPEKSINAYNTLKDWGMQMLVGTTTSGSCIAVAAETYNDNMFQITPSGSAVECVENPNVFRVCFSDPDQGTASAQYIGEHQLATKVAIIYDSSSVYSDGIRENFVAEAANQGIEIVASEAFTADSKTDFSVQLDKAKEAGAELVFLPIYYQEASIILKQAADKDFSPIFFGCDGMDGILGVEGFDTSLAEGMLLLTPFSADLEENATFVDAYQEAYGSIPNQFAADGYDCVYTLYTALQAAGCTSDMTAEEICEAVIPVMTEITVDGLTGDLSWVATGEVNKAFDVYVVENGTYQVA